MTTHDCPGGCGAQVARHRFACASCWHRLPADLRAAIRDTYSRDHLAHARAMTEAMHWYRTIAQPQQGEPRHA